MKAPKPDQTAERIARHAEQMRRARTRPQSNPLMGLATFGMIGWSVSVPTLGAIALGLWLDRVAPQSFSWTITLLFAGVILGVMIAWRWVMRERIDSMEQDDDGR